MKLSQAECSIGVRAQPVRKNIYVHPGHPAGKPLVRITDMFLNRLSRLGSPAKGPGCPEQTGRKSSETRKIFHQRKAGRLDVQSCSQCTLSYFRSSLLQRRLLKNHGAVLDFLENLG
jgi:hypothetical protein